jgi:hypothetical protein
LALAAAGCAIPTQSGPSTIANNRVPFGLLNPQSPVTTTTQPKPSSLVPIQVFFVSPSQQFVAVNRVVEAPAPLSSVITSMLAGPTKAEAASPLLLTTAIPNSVVCLSASTEPGSNTVVVDFNDAFSQISGTSAELAVAQVVSTIAAQNGNATGVIFEIQGQRTSVPIASGASVPGPVYLLQFVP